MINNKRGEMASGATWFISVIFGILVVFFIGLTVVNQGDYVAAASSMSDFFRNVVFPLVSFLLVQKDGYNAGNEFLMVLTFILLIIIVTATLESANIFGGSERTNAILNFSIGIIVSIIGVRYMPSNIWGSLTAPSSALVATVLVGLPFAALFIMTIKIKSFLARKLLWLFYFVFMSYLILRPYPSAFSWAGMIDGFKGIYLLFLALAGLMLAFDGTVRNLIKREGANLEVNDEIGALSMVERYNIRKEIAEYQRIIADTSLMGPRGTTHPDKIAAEKKIKRLQKLYGDLKQFD